MHGVAFGYAPTSTERRRASLDICGLQSADNTTCHGCYLTLAGSRAFSVAGPQAWNQLPVSLLHTDCVATFKRHLKTLLFMAAYGVTDN